MISILLNAFVALGVAHASPQPLFVLIDPGHGGRDHGTVRQGTREADITLAVSRQLREILKKDRRFHAELTRESDDTLTLFQRARLAKTKAAQIFVSIHVNSSPDKKARGAEFYFQNQLPSDEESMKLAHQEDLAEAGENVQPITYAFLDENSYPTEVNAILNDLLDSDRVSRSSDLSKDLKLSWHGSRKSRMNSIRQAPFYVLNQMRTPSTLVELGFLTNEEDYRDLTSASVQKRMAEDLYRGLVRYKESLDKVAQNP